MTWHIDNPEDWRRALAVVAPDLVRVYPWGCDKPEIIEMSGHWRPETWIRHKLAQLPSDIAESVRVQEPGKPNWEHRPQRWVA